MPASSSALGQQLLDVPFPDMIKSMGLAIAQAQFELDNVSLRMAQMMSGEYEVPDPEDDTKTTKITSTVNFNNEEVSLLELGFTPNFYQFVDTIIEVKISISMSLERQYKRSSTRVRASTSGGHAFFYARAKASVSTVSASYSSKYQYSAEGSSLLRTKLVPVPAPAILEERIRRILDDKFAEKEI